MLCHSVPELYQSRASCRLRSPALSPSVPICVSCVCVMGVCITCVCVCVLSMSAFCIVCHAHGLLVHAKFLPLPHLSLPSTTCSSGLQRKSFISITMIKRTFALKLEVTPKGACRNELGKPESPPKSEVV